MKKDNKLDEIYGKQRQVLREKLREAYEALCDQDEWMSLIYSKRHWAVSTLKELKKNPEAVLEDYDGYPEKDLDDRTAIIAYAKKVLKHFPSYIKKENDLYLRLKQEEKAAREAYNNFVPKPPRLVQIDIKNVHQDDPCASAHGPDCNRC